MDKPDRDRQRSLRRSRLLDRVVALRNPRPGAPTEPAAGPPAPSTDALSALQTRIDHLEAALEGLQDAVYRDAQRHDRELAELRRELQPGRIAQSLSGDARRRGL
jgi:hypothetical protein